jgi:hypothetical protein
MTFMEFIKILLCLELHEREQKFHFIQESIFYCSQFQLFNSFYEAFNSCIVFIHLSSNYTPTIFNLDKDIEKKPKCFQFKRRII